MISREEAKELLIRRQDELCQRIEAKTGRELPIRPRFAEGIAKQLDSLPAVDAVEVVRKPIKGYEGYYEVDQFGRVFGVNRVIPVEDNGRKYDKPLVGKQMKQTMHDKGYKVVSLTRDGKTKQKFVHRLVAEAFIDNPDNLPMVNHKDEDKTNNFAENLEWCTAAYNNGYGTARKRRAKKLAGKTHTEEHRKSISDGMKRYRQKEREENGYCYNGRGEREVASDIMMQAQEAKDDH